MKIQFILEMIKTAFELGDKNKIKRSTSYLKEYLSECDKNVDKFDNISTDNYFEYLEMVYLYQYNINRYYELVKQKSQNE